MSDGKKLSQKQIEKKEKRLKKQKERYVKEMDKKRQSSFTKRLITAKRIGRIKKTEEKMEMSNASFILFAAAIALFSCACILTLSIPVGITGKEIPLFLSVILITVAAAVSYRWAEKYCTDKNKSPIKLWGAAMTMIFLIVTIKGRMVLRDGFLTFLKAYIASLNKYFATNLKLVVDPSKDRGVTFFLIICALIFVISILCARGNRAKYLVMFIILSLCCGMVMLVGIKPHGFWLLLSFVMIMCLVNLQDVDRASVKTAIVLTMSGLTVFLLAGYMTGLKEPYEQEYSVTMRKKLEDTAQDLQHYLNENFKLNIKVFGDDIRDNGFSLKGNEDEEGSSIFDLDFRKDKNKVLNKLKKSGGLAFGNIPEGKINLDYKKERIVIETDSIGKDIYLKGYVADSYDGEFNFMGPTIDVNKAQIDVLNEMIDQGRASMNDYTVLYVEGGTDHRILTITNKEKDNLQYVPYYSIGVGDHDKLEDRTRYLTNGMIYSIADVFEQKVSSVVDISSPEFDESAYENEWRTDPFSSAYLSTDDYVGSEFSLERYETDRFMCVKALTSLFKEQLNDDELYFLENIRENKELCNQRTIRLARIVSRYLSENMTYTLSPPYNNTELNDIDYFLQKSQKGYCMHYAQSAVILLAAMNVPVRYVEGYVADKDYLRDNAKYDESKEMYRVALHGANAHAWIEIYLYGYGWVPVEVTRSFSQIMNPKKNEPTKAPTTKPATTGPAATTPAPSTPAPSTTQPPATDKPKETAPQAQPTLKPTTLPKTESVSRIDMTAVLRVLALIGIAAAVMLLIILIIRKRRREFYRKISTDTGLIKYMLKTLESLAAKRGIVYSNEKTYGKYADELAEEYDELEIEDILIFLSNVNKQLFSRETLTETEMESCKQLYADFIIAEYEKRGRFGKLLLLSEKKRIGN